MRRAMRFETTKSKSDGRRGMLAGTETALAATHSRCPPPRHRARNCGNIEKQPTVKCVWLVAPCMPFLKW